MVARPFLHDSVMMLSNMDDTDVRRGHCQVDTDVRMRKVLTISCVLLCLILILILSSCNTFQRVLNSKKVISEKYVTVCHH